jgi:acetyl-CoA C-acetyltransferase
MDVLRDLHPRTPVLIGCGQLTDTHTPPDAARSPMDLLEDAARLAAHDAGLSSADLSRLDAISVLRLFSDSSPRFACPFGRADSPPHALAGRLGANPNEALYTFAGGNMPQWLLNRYGEAIVNGDVEFALVGGAEALRTTLAARRAGVELDWNEAGPACEEIGVATRGWNEHEEVHGMRAAIVMYPLLENAIRAHRGRALSDHADAMGRLFAGFAAVAKDNPYATRREGYGERDIATVDEDNPMIGFPYPKLMNANAFVDQAAVVLMTSVEQAREMGVSPSRWVFVHGCADTVDHWYMSERVNYHTCAPMGVAGRQALEMAGIGLDDIAHFDLYSCFPSAVELACQELGLSEHDPRGLTVTGGLPFFGGPGNNYVTHSIATMMDRLRSDAGSYGLVTANGNYVTKHAFGVYSTRPVAGRWEREPIERYQHALDAREKTPFTEHPNGAARVETYTVMHGRSGPELGIVVGRLLETSERFISNLSVDASALDAFERHEGVGRHGVVHREGERNIFVLG